jgi:hypothetical protein
MDEHKASAASITVSTGTVGSLTARNWFLNQYFPNSPMNLSKTVTSLRWQEQVAESIRVNMANGANLVRLSRELSNYTTEEDIAGTMREIERMARRIIGGDTSEYAEFQRLTRRIKEETSEMIQAGYPSRLGKSYAKVVTAAEALREDALDVAIEKAIEEKALSNAFRLATTEINKAINLGAYTRAVQDEDCVAMELILSTAGNNCDDCIDLAETDNGAGPGIWPIEQVPLTPVHPRCVLPTERIWWEGKLTAAIKSFFSGFIIKITTKNGQRFTVTTNHPILTSNGWVIAKELRKGDKVISCIRGKRPFFSIDPNNNKRPPRIKDVFRALEKSFKMTAKTVPVSPEDFHGDGRFINDNVNIINTNGLLLSDVEPLVTKNLGKTIFNKCCSGFNTFYPFCSIASFFKRNCSPSRGIMRSLRHFLCSLWSVKLFARKAVGLGLSAPLYASFYKPASDNYSRNPQAVSDAILRLSAEIAFDEIIKIKTRNYSGHVYDLQVEPSEIYISNGVIVKNCRCLLLPVYKLPSGADEDFSVDEDDYEGEFMQPIPAEVFDSIDE